MAYCTQSSQHASAFKFTQLLAIIQGIWIQKSDGNNTVSSMRCLVDTSAGPGRTPAHVTAANEERSRSWFLDVRMDADKYSDFIDVVGVIST